MTRMVNADELYNGAMKDEYFRFKESDKTGREAFAYSCAMQRLAEAPTIDAEPVRYGRWIKMTGMMPPEFHGHYECSECGWHLSGVRQMKNREEEFAYCPNCGAKMEEKWRLKNEQQ